MTAVCLHLCMGHVPGFASYIVMKGLVDNGISRRSASSLAPGSDPVESTLLGALPMTAAGMLAIRTIFCLLPEVVPALRGGVGGGGGIGAVGHDVFIIAPKVVVVMEGLEVPEAAALPKKRDLTLDIIFPALSLSFLNYSVGNSTAIFVLAIGIV